MSKSNLLMAVSIAALMAATPALAQSASETADTNTISGKVSQDWNESKQAVSNTVDDAKTSMSHHVVQAALLPQEPGGAPVTVSIDKRMTASGIIGKPVYNQKNERVATVEDVILDAKGHADLVVVKDGSFLGLGGKLAAFSYDSVIDRKKDGDLVMPITQKTIDNVAEFSYTPSDKQSVRVLPESGFSLKKIMDGSLLDPSGKKVAAIDNVTLRNGRANLVIASFDRILGIGGDKVALDFNPSEMIRDGKDNVDLQLSDAQAQNFETLKARKK